MRLIVLFIPVQGIAPGASESPPTTSFPHPHRRPNSLFPAAIDLLRFHRVIVRVLGSSLFSLDPFNAFFPSGLHSSDGVSPCPLQMHVDGQAPVASTLDSASP
jgi:hypothetical protein